MIVDGVCLVLYVCAAVRVCCCLLMLSLFVFVGTVGVVVACV